MSEKPGRFTPEWSAYVMGQFVADELVDGCPTVDGLRRVFQAEFGEIKCFGVDVVQSPSPDNQFTAVVHSSIQYGDGLFAEDVADVNRQNTPSEYAAHSTATASTRAEGRIYRKLLGLRKVISAEEAVKPGDVPTEKITNAQKNLATKLAKGLKVGVVVEEVFGKDLDSLTSDEAISLLSLLNEYKSGSKEIPGNFKG